MSIGDDADAWEEFDDWEEPNDCDACHGDGWVACSDPLGCTRQHHNRYGEHRCPECGGTGDA